jgi:hypothetical protein
VDFKSRTCLGSKVVKILEQKTACLNHNQKKSVGTYLYFQTYIRMIFYNLGPLQLVGNRNIYLRFFLHSYVSLFLDLTHYNLEIFISR